MFLYPLRTLFAILFFYVLFVILTFLVFDPVIKGKAVIGLFLWHGAIASLFFPEMTEEKINTVFSFLSVLFIIVFLFG